MSEQQQGNRLDQPPTLPDLPDFDALRAPALERLRHFTQIRDAAQAEIDVATEYLARLDGKQKPRPHAKPEGKMYSDAVYRQVLTAVGNHGHAALNTVASESGLSVGHTAAVLRSAAERGHVSRERRGRRLRYRITESGTEYATTNAG